MLGLHRQHIPKLVILFCLIYGTYHWLFQREIKQPRGVLIVDAPIQHSTSRRPLYFKGQVLEFLASYEIKARVLGKERYWVDPGSKNSPVDLALGWGPMSDTSVLEKMRIRQFGRFYDYRWSGAPPIPVHEVTKHSANVHIIPANQYIKDEVSKLRVGQLVTLKGYLVQISDFQGGHWKSSLIREDSGPGACELMYVEMIY